jgi:ATP-dependent helicase HrpA
VLREVHDRSLPPDHDAWVAAEPPTGRVIVIAPTRAACETIELALGLHLETVLEQQHGAHIRELAASGRGFGIVAGTGTGKTLAVRPIAESILRTTELRVGVVNREREATPETPSWNVVIVTTGIARRWFEDGDILPRDTLVVDEIHQTSAELELCLALGKRVGCRFVWLSATVDPTFYARYLEADAVVESSAFDPAKAADVQVVREKPTNFLGDRFLQRVVKDKRGVGMFLPTRAAVEEAAQVVAERFPRMMVAHYHGGEPIRVIRPFLDEGAPKPFFLSMTAAGQSALNVKGLDTVIIDDTRFANVIERGRNVLTKLHLGANEILQMAGRVHGRVAGGKVFILSDRQIDFRTLRPTAPDFQLAGDSERVAITCAGLGVRADELELPVPLDRQAYRRAVALLERRGVIENGRLTRYGKLIDALPVERPWAEMLVNAEDALVPYVAVAGAIESLHRMTREERDLSGLLVPGSDHLTAYNVYAEAYRQAGYLGEVYGLPRHLFDESVERWAERRGVLVKAIEDAALAVASIYRALDLELPTTLPPAREATYRAFADLVARYMPFDLVIDETTADGQEARVSKTSVCGSWGAIAGTLRYFADRFGVARASIEGTQLPMELVRRYATPSTARLVFDGRQRHTPLVLERRVEYFGFELEREVEPLEEIPPDMLPQARRVLAESLAREQVRHVAVKRNRPYIEEIREVYRRSGGETPRLGQAELTAWYERELAGMRTMQDFRAAPLRLDFDGLVAPDVRARWLALPDAIELRGREVPVEYDVEEAEDGARTGVIRLRLPEKVARTLSEAELPVFDRPVRFVVPRGQRGAARASTLEELLDILERPWTEEEVTAATRRRDDERESRQRDRRTSEAAGALRRERKGGGREGPPRGRGPAPRRRRGR